MKKIIQNCIAGFLSMVFLMTFAAGKNNIQEPVERPAAENLTEECRAGLVNAADYNYEAGKMIPGNFNNTFY